MNLKKKVFEDYFSLKCTLIYSCISLLYWLWKTRDIQMLEMRKRQKTTVSGRAWVI